MDGEESDRRSERDADNVIKIANQLVAESAIKEKDDGGNDDERGKRTKKDPRATHQDEDFDQESLSSCKSDEDYHEYKKRMMKKIKEQEKKIKKKKGKQSAVSNTDDNVTESGSRLQHHYDEKKKSSTSSALGQAEPVQMKGTKRNDSAEVQSSKRRPQKKGRGDANGSSDGNATADDVSEIESEMATSPRKAESAQKRESSEGQDLVDEDYDDKYDDTFTDESVHSENDNIIDNDYDDDNDETKKVKTNLKNKDNDPLVLSPVDQKPSHNHKKYDKTLVRQTTVNNDEFKQEIITDGIGNAEGEGKGKCIHVDICPTDSKCRGDGEFESDSKINERHNDIRGYAISEERAQVQRKKADRGKKSEKNNLQKAESNVINVEEAKEQKVAKHKPDLGLKKVPKENEIIFHPMTKTGENKYLKKQMNEVTLRKKGHATSMYDESKRKGRYFKDLSPRSKVIRGNIGDDGSESDGIDDETYSKILLRDGRASVSDTEHESDPRRKDYILAKSKNVSNYKASNQHVTFIENELDDDGDDDKLNYRVLIDVGREQEKERFRRERGRKRKEKEEKRQKRIEDMRGAANSGIIIQCTDAAEVASDEYETSPDDDIEVQTDVQKGVHQHHFQEEPASPAKGGNNVQLVQRHETTADFNDDNLDEDGESLTFKTKYPSDGDGDDEEKENANPETWYEAPNISTTEKGSRQLEIVGTKYVENENDRYAQHYKAFSESPNVDNDFLKSTNGTVAILSSHDNVPLETEGDKEVLHISVRSEKPIQNSLTWENGDKPNEKINSDSESDVSFHNQIKESDTLSKDKLAVHRNDTNERKNSASSVEMDVVSAEKLRELWLGSRRVSITKNNDEKTKEEQIQLNVEATSKSEIMTDLPKPELKDSDAINSESAQEPLSKNGHEEEITAVNIRDMWLGFEKQKDVVNTSQTMDENADKSPRSGTELPKKPEIALTSGSCVKDDNSQNDASYSDDFSETADVENVESAKTNFQTLKTDENYEKLNKSFRNEDEKNEPVSEKENEGVIEMNIHGLKEDESSSEDVHGIDALIEVLENQLESSKKGDDETTLNQSFEMNTSTNVDFKPGPSTSGEPENATQLHQMDRQSTNDSNAIQCNGFGPDSSTRDKYISEDGDTSSEEFDLQAKNYVNDILASISAVGFDDMKFQNPTPKAPTDVVDITGASVPLQKDQDNNEEENVKSEKSITHELKRQSPVNNDNADDINFEQRTGESNRKGEKMSINIPDISNFEPLSPPPKNSSLVDPNSPHAEKRRQQRLSVSFAINEDDAVKEREVVETEKLWEEADDFEKEDEYERLEKQIERTLCK